MTRQDFLQKTALAAAALMVAPLEAWAKAEGRKIRIAIIGCGSVSTQYLPHLTKFAMGHAEIVSVCDIVFQRAADAAMMYKIPNSYPNIESMLAGAPFDLMLTLTDMQEHGRLNRLAIMAGKNVWSEKPLANSYSEGKALLDLARSKNLRIWGAPAVVNSPQFAFMSKAIQEGKLGRVAAATAHYGHTGPTWSAFFYEKGGGSLPDLGVYNIASLTGLLGPAKSVIAMTSIVTPERTVDNKGKIKVEAEDNAQLILEHAGGAMSHIMCGFNYFDPHGHEGKGQSDHTIKIYGSHGNMGLVGYDWSPFGVDLATSDTEPAVRHVEDPGDYVWQQGATVISKALGDGSEPRINVEHALHVLEIIEAARKSGQKGRRVNLKSVFKWPMV